MLAPALVVGLALVAGLLAIGWVPEQHRSRLLPGAPAIGVAVLVAALHWTTLVVGVGDGMVVVAVVAVAVTVALQRRRPGWWRHPSRAWRTLVVALALGAVPAVAVALPMLEERSSRVVQVTLNNDAFYYVSLAEWLADHPAVEDVEIGVGVEGADAPSYGSVSNHQDIHLRIGEELLQAVPVALLDQPAVRTWYPVTATWLALLPGACYVAAVGLRARPVAGLVGGVVIGAASLVGYQALNQNSASVLGIALLPLAVGAVVGALDRDRRVPLALAGVSLAGVIGVYAEYAVLLGPVLAAVVLIRPAGERRPALRAAVTVVAFAVAVAPLAWIKAVRSFTTIAGANAPDRRSPFLDVGFGTWWDRFTGASALDDPSRLRPAGIVLAVAVVVGLGAAVVLHRRALWLAVIAAFTVLLVKLGPIDDNGYSHERAVGIGAPLLLLGAVMGWDRLVHRLQERPPRPGAAGGAIAAVVIATAVWLGVNLRQTVALTQDPLVEMRRADEAFDDAALWVDEVGDGSNVVVAVPRYFDQLWIADALRDRPEVSYGALYPDYFTSAAAWDGEPRRYVLIGVDAITDLDADMVIRSNERFSLVDLHRGEGLVAVATAGWWPSESVPPVVSQWMADEGQLLVVTAPGTDPRLRVEGQALDLLSPLGVEVREVGGPALTRTTTIETIDGFTVPLPGPVAYLVIDNDEPAVLPGTGDVRLLSFRLTGLRRG